MQPALYLAAVVAVIATLLAISQSHPLHALLYLIVSLLAVAAVFFTVGAAFAGVLEVIVYAGAIMVLFVFVVMLLNLGAATVDQERRWLRPRTWIGPGLLSLGLLGELTPRLLHSGGSNAASGAGVAGSLAAHAIAATQIGAALYGPYLLAVELASMLLLAALVTAVHVGRHA